MSSPPPAKRVRFAEAAVVAEEPPPRRPAGSHTLDSDEEDGDESAAGKGEEADRLREEDIEGQEEATITNDDGIAITPFNMREEMREGYFDSAGCYIFNKEDKEIHDSWLESVDWESVKRKAAPTAASSSAAKKDASSDKDNEDSDPDGGAGGSDSDSGSDELGLSQLADLCAAVRGFLQPGETVAGAIKRLGGGANRALSASQRLRLKKAGGAAGTSKEEAAAAAANRERMLALSELAGRLVSAGHMTAYQMDAAQLARLGGVGDAEAAAATTGGVDMFAEDEPTGGLTDTNSKDDQTKTENKDSEMAEEGGVFWYYRVSDDPNAELMGPFSSQRMLEWAESDTGWPGGHRTVFVRKRDAAPDAPFYSSTRIDFDLYV
ncbi:hypothetical protein BOX15_Mlig019670g3 [Macrostomum lignano]|uniref:GYF domain-containing protein n=1 Tax=Macrostomum lignano TaxID=282301 RepID=A0A267G0A0_9PLAT|nr:hypothetical protein BOX15_Mlig019670g3 [Macrostomum lignano]